MYLTWSISDEREVEIDARTFRDVVVSEKPHRLAYYVDHKILGTGEILNQCISVFYPLPKVVLGGGSSGIGIEFEV